MILTKSAVVAEAIKTNPKNVVFVHCKAGRSRSVSVVIGYLIKTQKYTLKSAYKFLQTKRRGVCPNIGFLAALNELEFDVHGKITHLYDDQ